MRHTILYTALCAVLCASCHLETSDNGYLDGFWHLETVDTLATGGVRDVSQQHFYWSVQMRLMQCTDTDNAHQPVLLRFVQTDDSLHVSDPHIFNYHLEGGDIPIDDPALLAPYGFGGLDDHFAKEQMGKGWMVLRNDKVRLHLRRM